MYRASSCFARTLSCRESIETAFPNTVTLSLQLSMTARQIDGLGRARRLTVSKRSRVCIRVVMYELAGPRTLSRIADSRSSIAYTV